MEKRRNKLLQNYFQENRRLLNLNEIENLAGVEHGTITKVIFGYEINKSDYNSLTTVCTMIEKGELQNCVR